VSRLVPTQRSANALALLTLTVTIVSLLVTGPAVGREPRPRSSSAGSSPAWLALINRYRSAAGLSAVSDEPAWDLGIMHHLTYLVKTPPRYFTGRYASAHTENPASPYYTPDGAREAGYSDLALGGAESPVEAIDGWLRSPFHAVGMLRAQLTKVALADDPATGFAGLDVIQGLDYSLPADPQPILFPGPGITTDLLTYGGGELPDPLQTCRWSDASIYGLPLIALLPQPPRAPLSATVTGPHGVESTANRQLCVVDENTYYTTDSVYGPTGREILQDDHAVFLIPRHALLNGRYSVTIIQPGEANIAWSFAAAAPITRTSILTLRVAGSTVHVQIASPAGVRLRCALTRRGRRGFAPARFTACARSVTYRNLRTGSYRFAVHSRAGDVSRRFVVRATRAG
jgi:hypothetical protein